MDIITYPCWCIHSVYDDVLTWTRFTHYWPFQLSVVKGFPSQRASYVEIWCLFDATENKLLDKQSKLPVIEEAMTLT